MTVSTIDESQRKAARVAGFAYLFTFVIVVLVNFGIHERLMVAGNAAETARNILAHERLFRIGVAGDLVYEAGLVVLLSALYVILKPVGRTLALLERLVYASMWVLMSLNLLNCAEAVERCRLPAGAWNRSIPDFGEAVSLRFRRLLRWPAFLWYPPPAATCSSSRAISREDWLASVSSPPPGPPRVLSPSSFLLPSPRS